MLRRSFVFLVGLTALGWAFSASTVARAEGVEALPRTQLIMFEQEGCFYCRRWMAEVGDAYEKTAEGRAAPLRTVDMHAPLPADLQINGRVVFSPTFVLVRDGVELARLEGYAGEDFFWGLLGMLLDEHVPEWNTQGHGG